MDIAMGTDIEADTVATATDVPGEASIILRQFIMTDNITWITITGRPDAACIHTAISISSRTILPAIETSVTVTIFMAIRGTTTNLSSCQSIDFQRSASDDGSYVTSGTQGNVDWRGRGFAIPQLRVGLCNEWR